MTIKELIIKYAKENGYTGLYNTELECGCSLSEDYPLCNNICYYCEFGYVTECVNCNEKDFCHLHKGGSDMCVRQTKGE